MAEKRTLTHTFIKDYPAPNKRMEIYDTVQSGMILRVTPTGHKSFAFRYWYDGRSTQRTVGKFGDVSLSEARETVGEWKRLLSDGIDPIAEKKKNKAETPITLGEYIEVFKKDYLKRKLKASTQKTYTSRLNKVLDHSITKSSLRDVDRADVRSFLKTEAKEHPTNANRLQAILSKVFNEAIDDGHITENPIKGMDKLTNETSRDVRYTDDDIKAIWNVISEEWEPMQSLLKMLLITGQRLGETSKMKWDDIHNRTWYIPQGDTKNKKPHQVPLPNMALNLLKKLKPISGDSEYVFASQRDKTGHLSHFMNVVDRIREETKLNDFRLHDLRHIVATNMISPPINKDNQPSFDRVEFIIVGKILNHKGLSANNAITSRYINTDFSMEKAEALKSWAGHLTELVTQLSISKVG